MSNDVRVIKDIEIETNQETFNENQNENTNITVRRIPQVYSNPLRAGYFRPWRFMAAERSGTSKIIYAKTTRFRIVLDVQQFMTNLNVDDFKVDIVGKNIEVQAEHDYLSDTLGQNTRWMKRKYKIPPDVDLDSVTSQLYRKGTLVINGDRNLKDSLGENFFKEFPEYASKDTSKKLPSSETIPVE